MNRRHLLRLLGAASGASLIDNPANLLYRNLLDGLLAKASASAGGYNPRRYVNIQLAGGPARWTHDVFLNPRNQSGVNIHPEIGTRFRAPVSGRYTSYEYQSIPYVGSNNAGDPLHVPWLWQFNVPAPGGDQRPMTDLLDNLLCFQGMDVGTVSHPGAQAAHFRPTGSLASMPTINADHLPYPIPGISASVEQFSFASLANKSPVSIAVRDTNLLQELLNPFLAQAGSSYIRDRESLEAAIQRTISSIDDLARLDHPGAQRLSEDRRAAEQLLRSGFGDIGAAWNTLLPKYQDLISRALQTRGLSRLNDQIVGKASGRSTEYNIRTAKASSSDCRDVINSNSTIRRMAESFALTEYVLLNELSGSVCISPSFLENIENSYFHFDEHYAGMFMSLYLNSMFNYAFSACLLELITQLKQTSDPRATGRSYFDETVLYVSGEFGRIKSGNKPGSDHSAIASNVALYSGALKGPVVLGHLKDDRNGAHGQGGDVPTLNGQLKLAHVAASTAHILRAPSPITSVQTVVNLTDEHVLTPLIETSRVV